ncbi:hypothetical protein CEXT_304241 [Caerostris extrusa]|uniref:Uncharacterized protein n=1 Tax=Caerostris extrusa TaxID=172846 RepID=A0AAV4SJF0_CAEEX|nr:hypothetical protein CEXT_304241 [Caerostris extrusa]
MVTTPIVHKPFIDTEQSLHSIPSLSCKQTKFPSLQGHGPHRNPFSRGERLNFCPIISHCAFMTNAPFMSYFAKPFSASSSFFPSKKMFPVNVAAIPPIKDPSCQKPLPLK